MKKISMISVLLFCLVIAGCNNPVNVEPQTKTVDVPGQLSVLFSRSVDVKQAYDLLISLSLRPIDLRNLEDDTERNFVTVGVPEGEEEFWMMQLAHYPFILSVNPKTKQVPA